MKKINKLMKKLKKLAKAADPGPWEWEGRKVDSDGYVSIPQCSYLVGMICLNDTYEGYQNDCDYMAAANPKAILKLIKEFEKLQSEHASLLLSMEKTH